jgi:hypothetical protein
LGSHVLQHRDGLAFVHIARQQCLWLQTLNVSFYLAANIYVAAGDCEWFDDFIYVMGAQHWAPARSRAIVLLNGSACCHVSRLTEQSLLVCRHAAMDLLVCRDAIAAAYVCLWHPLKVL